jgi:hypothetical protein
MALILGIKLPQVRACDGEGQGQGQGQSTSTPIEQQHEPNNDNQHSNNSGINSNPTIGSDQLAQAHQEVNFANSEITNRLNNIAAALLTANPEITNDLHFIHRAILDDPSQVTLLTDEQKTIFFAGLMKKTGAEIIATASKSKAGSTKKLAALSVDDLL